MMRRSVSALAGALVVTLACAPAPAWGDTFEATRSDSLVPFGHRIDVTIHRGYADIVTERTVFNGGDEHDQAIFFLELPAGAVATRLRTQGSLGGQPHWFEGELLEAEHAAARYRELTGIGGYYPKDPALLSWRSQSTLALQVFPCPPGEFKRVAYTLRVPTTYEGGRERLVLPVLGDDRAVPHITVAPGVLGGEVLVDGRAVSPGTPFLLTEEIEVSLAHPASRLLEGALASIPAGERAVTQLRVDASERLSTVPRNAAVVVLLDNSHSVGDAGVRASSGAARSFLSHFEGTGARVRVARFDRSVRPLTDGFTDPAAAMARLDEAGPPLENGSHLDRALDFAVEAFGRAPEGAPRRLLVLTDALTRAAVSPAAMRQVARRTGAIVHVADLVSGPPSLHRDDDHAFAQLARGTGGVFWSGSAEATEGDEQRAVFEELARPLRLDRVRFAFRGAEVGVELPDVLDEGESISLLELTDGALSSVELTGELWSRPVRRELHRDAAHERRWAGLVFGSDLFHDLDEPTQEQLAWQGRVVSPVTSFLAIEPGVRPSTAGLDWEGMSGIGFGGGGIGLGTIGTLGRGGGLDEQAWLEDNVEPLASRCGVLGRASLAIETTLNEVVEVEVDVEGGTPDETRCLTEAVWGLALDGAFLSTWARRNLQV